MKMKRYKKIEEFGKDLGLSHEQIDISKMKSKLKKEIQSEVLKQELNPTILAAQSGLARSAVSGILNGSLQSVSLERLIRLAMALNIRVDLSIKKVA